MQKSALMNVSVRKGKACSCASWPAAAELSSREYTQKSALMNVSVRKGKACSCASWPAATEL